MEFPLHPAPSNFSEFFLFSRILISLSTVSLSLNLHLEIHMYWTLRLTRRQFEKILSYIEHGKIEGTTLLTGGKRLGDKGYYIEPSIFVDVKVHI